MIHYVVQEGGDLYVTPDTDNGLAVSSRSYVVQPRYMAFRTIELAQDAARVYTSRHGVLFRALTGRVDAPNSRDHEYGEHYVSHSDAEGGAE